MTEGRWLRHPVAHYMEVDIQSENDLLKDDYNGAEGGNQSSCFTGVITGHPQFCTPQLATSLYRIPLVCRTSPFPFTVI